MTRTAQLALAAALLIVPAAGAQTIDWAVPVTGWPLEVRSMATTPVGGVLLTGKESNSGPGGFLRRYDAAGVMTSHQTVSGSPDSVAFTQGLRVAVDSAGNAFLLGEETAGVTPRNRTFLNKFAPDGTLLWTATNLPRDPSSLAVDNAGGAYLTSDAFFNPPGPEILRYGAADVLWRQAQPANTLLATAPGGGVFSAHRNPVTQLQVSRRDAAGALLWNVSLQPMVQQLGTPQHFVSNAAGNLALVSVGTTPPGPPQFRLTTFDAAGTILATSDLDLLPSVFTNGAATMDPSGNVYIVGAPKNQPSFSTLLIQKYRPDGSRAWSFDIGAALPWDFDQFSAFDAGVAYDGQGRLVLLGVGLPPNNGSPQTFLAKLSTVPEPSGPLLLALGCAAAFRRRRCMAALNRR